MGVLVGEGVFEGIEVFTGEDDGVQELVFVLCAD